MHINFFSLTTAALTTLVVTHAISPRGRWAKFVFTFLALAILATWKFIDDLSGEGLNYATLYHLRSGLKGAGTADFSRQITIYCASLAMALAISFILTLAARKPNPAKFWPGILYALSVVCFAIFNPLTRDAWALIGTNHYKYNSAISSEYANPSENLPPAKRKNIVVIYGESLERTYLDEKAFPGLMPNIKRLSGEALDFTDVRPSMGTGWTIAGMVASLCGIPLTVWKQEDANHLDRFSRFLPAAGCASDWLSANGYTLEFYGGADSNFAGKAKFLASHGFSTIRDRSYFLQQSLPPSDFSSWGLHDDVLLDQAFTRYQKLSSSNSPFLLGVLTLDTHHPSGHVPAACGDLKYKRLEIDYPILDAVACSDQLIGKFVERIRASPGGTDTIIVLASDHLGMPNDAREILEGINKDRRDLLLFLGPQIRPERISTPSTTLDTGASLLSLLAGKPVPLGFGRPAQYPRKDGISHALFSKQDTSAYYAFSQKLWGIDRKAPMTLLRNNMIRFGTQEVQPPFAIILDNEARVKEMFLAGESQTFKKQQGQHSIEINYCAAFSTPPATQWCALENFIDGTQRLFNQDELLKGVHLTKSNNQPLSRHTERTDNFLIRNNFEDTYPSLIRGVVQDHQIFSDLKAGVLFNGPFVPMKAGQYQAEISGSANRKNHSWADVIAKSGEIVFARGPLTKPTHTGNIIFSADIDIPQDVRDVEIRVYAGEGDAIRVDSLALYPRQQ